MRPLRDLMDSMSDNVCCICGKPANMQKIQTGAQDGYVLRLRNSDGEIVAQSEIADDDHPHIGLMFCSSHLLDHDFSYEPFDNEERMK